jgi:hypothetical protein
LPKNQLGLRYPWCVLRLLMGQKRRHQQGAGPAGDQLNGSTSLLVVGIGPSAGFFIQGLCRSAGFR